tara:strand:- start:155 stop:337 length:183 start_codon:yes stop_codon:yes gene_type:complete
MCPIKIGDLIQLNGDDGVVYYGTVLHKGKRGIIVVFSDGDTEHYYYEELPHERMYILEVS